MIKQLVTSCSAVLALSACTTNAPDAASPKDFCATLSVHNLEADLNRSVTVTKRLLPGRDSAWAYCLYGSMTEHFVTLSAPLEHPAGNVHVVVDPKFSDHITASVDSIPDGYRIERIDLPPECDELIPRAEAVVGHLTSARGSVNPGALTCDFIGVNGSISAQSRPTVLAEHTELNGVSIIDEPDARLNVVVGTGVVIDGIVDHRRLSIRISGTELSDSGEEFARDFLEASR